jgi:hypothetical protein
MNNTGKSSREQLYIIDAIGPFFQGYKDDTINWSKIPFQHLEKGGHVDREKFRKIKEDFAALIQKFSQMGYNAISIDDVAHLVDFDFYPGPLQEKIQQYQNEYHHLFKLTKTQDLKIFVNTDIMFFNQWIEQWTQRKDFRILRLLNLAFETLFRRFPIDGIILRIGESDGVDVKGDFLSRLTIKTPQQANRYLKHLLPVFEQFNTSLIFRTWTVGAYKIGDLIWNKKTYEQVLQGIQSKNFMVSMKYGNTDFFDQLRLNPLFFHGSHQKIIELQTRREREGFGVLPYYVGWQYESYYTQLKDLDTLVGISVWCQTGGWTQWRNITFLKDSSIWSELNTFATIKIFREHLSAKKALKIFFNNKKFVKFVKQYHKVLNHILYIEGFSDKELYFRRARIPPLLWVSWDHITISPLMVSLLNYAGQRRFKMGKKKLKKILELGRELGIEDIEFLYDTLKILSYCRKMLWKNPSDNRLNKKIEKYTQKYPDSFNFSTNFSVHTRLQIVNQMVFKLLIRTQPEYRRIDRLLTTRFFSSLFYFIVHVAYIRSKNLPKFVNKQAMKLKVLFK